MQTRSFSKKYARFTISIFFFFILLVSINQSEAFSKIIPINVSATISDSNMLENQMNMNTACNHTITLSSDKTVYLSGDKISFKPSINPRPDEFLVEYWVEDLNGRMLKKAMNTSSGTSKTYTHNTILQEVILIKARLIEADGCSINKTAILPVLVLNPNKTSPPVLVPRKENQSGKPLNAVNNPATSQNNQDKEENLISGKVIYESENEQLKKKIPYMIMISFAILLVILLVIRKNFGNIMKVN
jgi:hypothetical protein